MFRSAPRSNGRSTGRKTLMVAAAVLALTLGAGCTDEDLQLFAGGALDSFESAANAFFQGVIGGARAAVEPKVSTDGGTDGNQTETAQTQPEVPTIGTFTVGLR
jgi:hypothetical protein